MTPAKILVVEHNTIYFDLDIPSDYGDKIDNFLTPLSIP